MKKYDRYTKPNRRPQGFVPAIVLLSCVMMLVGVSAFLRVTDIQVSVSEYYTPEEVTEVSEIRKGESLVMLNVSKISARIEEKLMFVKDVRIERKYPGTVDIHVSVSMPVACIRDNLDFWTMDIDGQILEKKTGHDVENLISVRGIPSPVLESGKLVSVEDDDTDYAGVVSKLLQSVSTGEYAFHTTCLDVSDLGNIEIGAGNYTITVGSVENVVGKLALANAIILEQPENARGTVDVSNGETGHFIPNR